MGVSDLPRVLYIAGLGRSGSTILDLMLGQTAGFVAVGELSYLWGRADEDLCGCGRAFAACPFWSAVGERAFGGWDRVDRGRIARLRGRIDRGRRMPALAAKRTSPEQRELTDAVSALYRAIADVAGAGIVVDSTKHPSTALLLRTMPGLDLRVIHLIRDSRGVAYSWTKVVPRPGIAGGAMMDRYPPWRMALRWNGYNAVLHALRPLGVPMLRLRYEDLIEHPGRLLEKITGFAGHPMDRFPFLEGRTITTAEAHTIAGNPIRFDRGPMELRRDDAWRSELPRRQRRLVTVLTGPLLAAYGYLRQAR